MCHIVNSARDMHTYTEHNILNDIISCKYTYMKFMRFDTSCVFVHAAVKSFAFWRQIKCTYALNIIVKAINVVVVVFVVVSPLLITLKFLKL